MKKMKMLVCAIKNLQGVCRGWRGRNTAMRRRVIREAVRFVVRTSILFGAARASAELMEVRNCLGVSATRWECVNYASNCEERCDLRIKIILN